MPARGAFSRLSGGKETAVKHSLTIAPYADPMRLVWLAPVLTMVCLGIAVPDASAQTYMGDARSVAMGGDASSSNIAASMVGPARGDAILPVPLGLSQVLGDRDVFNPTSDAFDPARAIELAANPLHYTFGRTTGTADEAQARFFRDLINGELSRDLSRYRGFRISERVTAESLASPAVGGTVRFARRPDGRFHGVFIGAGPYLSFRTMLGTDPKLIDILGSELPVYYPNSALRVGDTSAVQLAMSVVVGYRGRLALPGAAAATSRDGVYVAANYRHLRGFKYLQPEVAARFDLDDQGLLTFSPATMPVEVDLIESGSGTGRAVDVGVQVVRGSWEGGAGVNGIGNQIGWTGLTRKRFTLDSLLLGGEFQEDEQGPLVPMASLVIKLPVVTTGNITFDNGQFAVTAAATRGFNGTSFRGGTERRFGQLAVRGGARFSRGHWDPTYGFGIGRRVALDVGFYSTHNTLQGKRQTSMAVSVRIQPRL
jgi:hypothetical protein